MPKAMCPCLFYHGQTPSFSCMHYSSLFWQHTCCLPPPALMQIAALPSHAGSQWMQKVWHKLLAVLAVMMKMSGACAPEQMIGSST